jgi:peptidoglycan/xylan/chitin deacetylase (PgdA/CDA1 family)
MDAFPESLSRVTHISASRKILCTAALAGATLAPAVAPHALGAVAPGPVRARLSQAGRRLILSLRSTQRIALAGLDPQPRADSRYLCLELRRAGRGGGRRLCLDGSGGGRGSIGLELLNASGRVTKRATVPARVKRPEPRKLVLALLPTAAELSPHRYEWRVLANLGGCRSPGRDNCEQSLPPQGAYAFRLRPVRAVGCTGGGDGPATNGPRDRKVLALTFDDGPSEYTPGFLDVLREKHVPGTFFEIGQEMAGDEAAMRRILREGDEIGNHTMHHTEFPGYGDIAPVTSLIESITRFRPCLFRPPGGAVDSSVIAAASEDGLRTITWDVDPSDWSNPGSAAVYSRVVEAAQPGSIILMHDGGGPREGTLAALPRIIDTLRARGYAFATVTGLLGGRMLYRPYG